MSDLPIYLLDAANHVLILTLIALGLAIIFGLVRVINMAHGEFLMLGAYSVLVVQQAGGSYWLGLMVAPLVVGLVGLVVEELVVRHVYHRLLDTILATWGLSLILKQGMVLLFGPGSYSITLPTQVSVDILGTGYPLFRLVIMAISLFAVAFTLWLFFFTKFGLSARAVIANRDMASCLGLDTRFFDRATFVYGSALAGLAGGAIAPLISIDPQLGAGYLVPAFLAVLVGGLGSVLGPLAGAGTVGVVDNLVARLYSPVWSQLVVLVLAILLIRLFPRGLVSRKDRSA